jgi:hypothetical protein
MRLPVAALALVLAATPAQAAFDPIDFFRGRTHGEGTLKVTFQAAKRMSVDSLGRIEGDGSLLLRQVIHEPGKPPRTRYWQLRQVDGGGFTGTLTDAAGPVRVDVAEDKVRIRYKGKNHLDFDQVLTPSGASEVRNAMRVKRFGIIVAHFNEVIRKLD